MMRPNAFLHCRATNHTQIVKRLSALCVVLLLFACIALTYAQSEEADPFNYDEVVPTEPDLRLELLEMSRIDQEARSFDPDDPGGSSAGNMVTVDAINSRRLEELLEIYDWLDIDLVGCDGADAAWLIAQHADNTKAVQVLALERLEVAVEKGQAKPKHLAYLTDRVLTGANEKQLYGTQYLIQDGFIEPLPIEDEANVNARREAVGLDTLEEYLEFATEQLENE